MDNQLEHNNYLKNNSNNDYDYEKLSNSYEDPLNSNKNIHNNNTSNPTSS